MDLCSCARLTVLYSIIRITVHRSRQRKLAIFGFFFILTFIFETALYVGICEQTKVWRTRPTLHCHLTLAVPLFHLLGRSTAEHFAVRTSHKQTCFSRPVLGLRPYLTLYHYPVLTHLGASSPSSRHHDICLLLPGHHRLCR